MTLLEISIDRFPNSTLILKLCHPISRTLYSQGRLKIFGCGFPNRKGKYLLTLYLKYVPRTLKLMIMPTDEIYKRTFLPSLSIKVLENIVAKILTIPKMIVQIFESIEEPAA